MNGDFFRLVEGHKFVIIADAAQLHGNIELGSRTDLGRTLLAHITGISYQMKTKSHLDAKKKLLSLITCSKECKYTG